MVCRNLTLLLCTEPQSNHELMLLITDIFCCHNKPSKVEMQVILSCVWVQCHVEARVQNGQSNRPVQDKVRIMDENVKPLRDNNSGNGRTNERFGALVRRVSNHFCKVQGTAQQPFRFTAILNNKNLSYL